MDENDISTIDEIRALASKPISTHLRTPILSDDVLCAFARFVDCDFEGDEQYIDIPINHIFSVYRADLVSDGMTCLECLMGKDDKGLHGRGWPIDVYAYFESEIADACFPHHKARGALQCYSYNGVVGCANGNHRLVAAVCYMAAKYGQEAVLRQVRTRCSSVNVDFLKNIDQIYPRSVSTIRFASRTSVTSWWSELDGFERLVEVQGIVYSFADAQWHKVSQEESWKDRLPLISNEKRVKVNEALSYVEWHEVPRTVLMTMLHHL